MAGRVRRKQGLIAAEARAAAGGDADQPHACALCARPIATRIEWHHPIPKSRGGTEIVPVNPICHRTIHASLTNQELATGFAGMEALRQHPPIARFLRWIADKPADFHAPTRRTR